MNVWTALVAIGGSLLAALLVATITLRVARRGREDQARRDIENAAGEFLAAMTKAVGFVAEIPNLDQRHPVVIWSRLSASISHRILPGRAWVRGRRQLRRTLGDQPFIAAERVTDAAARLRVLDPGPALLAAVEACLMYLEGLGTNRSPERLAEWSTIRQSLLDAISQSRASVAERL